MDDPAARSRGEAPPGSTVSMLIELHAMHSFAALAFGVHPEQMEIPRVPGAQFDPSFGIVPIPRTKTARLMRGGITMALEANAPATYVTRAAVPSEQVEDFVKRATASPNVKNVFADPRIQPIGVCPGSPPVGTHMGVFRAVQGDELTSEGMDGTGVKVVIVDTGINRTYLSSAGKDPAFDADLSWGPLGGQPLGEMPVDHGTMCAFDVCIAAPRCTLVDHAVLTSTTPGGSDMDGLLSDAIRSYSRLLQYMGKAVRPFAGHSMPPSLVVNNSWGMFHPSWDFPVGSPQNYSDNPEHPFNILVGSLEAAGADILFAAGNCGPQCPDIRCQNLTNAGIFGANSSPAVTCVAGVDLQNRLAGYSTNGPGRLEKKKPDIAGFTHFAGSGVYSADGGTSAATPVVAGVVAALRRLYPPSVVSPADLRTILRETARHDSGFNFETGYGIINVAAILERLQKSFGGGGAPAAKPDRRERPQASTTIKMEKGKQRKRKAVPVAAKATGGKKKSAKKQRPKRAAKRRPR